jgi:hypothetical protein
MDRYRPPSPQSDPETGEAAVELQDRGVELVPLRGVSLIDRGLAETEFRLI